MRLRNSGTLDRGRECGDHDVWKQLTAAGSRYCLLGACGVEADRATRTSAEATRSAKKWGLRIIPLQARELRRSGDPGRGIQDAAPLPVIRSGPGPNSAAALAPLTIVKVVITGRVWCGPFE